MTALFHRLIVLIVLAGAAIVPLHAQTPPSPPTAGTLTAPSPLAAQRQVLDAAKLQLDQLDRALQNRDLSDAQLADLRRSLTDALGQSREASA